MDEKLLEERKKIILDIIDSPNYVPMKIKELAILLNVSKENREDLAYVLNLLVSEGKIGVSKKGKYGKVSSNLKLGVFSGTKNGYGFVAIEGETEELTERFTGIPYKLPCILHLSLIKKARAKY